jgi:hypothetical protein
MPVTVGFFSNFEPPLSLDHFGFFRLGTTAYQMVPFRESRQVILAVVGGKVQIASADPSIVQIGPVGTNLPSSINLMKFDGTSTQEHFFILHSVSVGRTMIVVEDERGHRLRSLTVSVKRNIEKKYELLILQDIKRKSQRSFNELLRIMEDVKKVFLRQANVTLRQVYMPNVMYLEEDLGDPIDVKLTSPTWQSWLAIRLAEKNQTVGATKQDFTVVSTWNIKDGAEEIVGVAPAFGSIILCEDLADKTGLLNASLFAHELAHAFKCEHRLIPPNLLMHESIGSLMMSDIEIDTINPTGL